MGSLPDHSRVPESCDSKTELRIRVRAILEAMPESIRQEASRRALTLLKEQKLWREARTILLYAPLVGELDVWPLVGEVLAAGKTAALPQYVSEEHSYIVCPITDATKDLVIGQFGIREPALHCASIPISRLDFALVPGVAFDPHGRRLGRGKGFYDRLLPSVLGKTCGVAFDEQIVETIPVGSHDVLVNCILTPTRWMEL
jgi:5-formyltetrahydrofolate cyclo-ligase